MTDPVVLTLNPTTITLVGGMIVTIIGVIVTGVLQVINAMRVTANTNQIVAVAKDTEAIKGHVNSEKTASEGRETTLRRENALLREMLTDKKATAGLLAQASALRARSPVLVSTVPAAVLPAGAAHPAPTDPATTELLESIDQHTADTAANTSRTETKLDTLKPPVSLENLVASGRLSQDEADALAAMPR